MIILIGSWIIFFLIIFQIGRLILGNTLVSILSFKDKSEWYEYFWIGLVGLIIFLQIWSIFLPVNGNCLLLVGGFSLITLLFSLRNLRFSAIKKFSVQNRTFLILSVIGLIGLSYYAWQPVNYFDTLLYHLNAVKWSNSFAVVPGLGNLHSRLGFNSSFFLLAALFDNFYLRNASVHIALPLLISVLSVEIVWIVKKNNNLLKIFVLILSPFIVKGVINSTLAPSFSPDFALAVVAVAASIELLKNNNISLFLALLLSGLMATIKLSGLIFFGVLFLFIGYELLGRIKRKKVNIIFLMLFPGIMLLAPYLARNIILSGWPLYPAPLFRINLPWAMPEVWVKGVSDLIKAWAISPGPGWPDYLHMGFLQWFPIWFGRNRNALEIKMFLLGCTAIAIFIYLYTRGNKQSVNIKPNFILILGSLASIVYIFLTAPDLRFGAIFVWIFFATTLTPFIQFIFDKYNNLGFSLAAVWVIFLLCVSLPFKLPGIALIRSVRKELAGTTKIVMFNQIDAKNQFGVFVPIDEETCGNSELPCTPEPNNVREIVPGDMSKGFVLIN